MRKYRPSNGTEGEGFFENHCYQCIHERWFHRMDEDKEEDKCKIMSNSILLEIEHPDYPEEWQYVNDKPTCTNWSKFDWGGDDDPREPPKPPEPPSNDPNQLLMPFGLFELLGISDDEVIVTRGAIIDKSILEDEKTT